VLNEVPRYEEESGSRLVIPPHTVLTLALDGGELSASWPGKFTPGDVLAVIFLYNYCSKIYQHFFKQVK